MALPNFYMTHYFESNICNESVDAVHKTVLNALFKNQTDLILELSSLEEKTISVTACKE